MGAGELIKDFKRNFFAKSCYTKRKYYLKVLVLFQTFQKIPPLPYRHTPEQETKLAKLVHLLTYDHVLYSDASASVAELIGLAMRQAATDAKEEEVNTSISKASDELRDYIKLYCSVDLEYVLILSGFAWVVIMGLYRHQHQREMTNAIASDKKIDALLLLVGNQLQTKASSD